mgnify:CR=1 FL=1
MSDNNDQLRTEAEGMTLPELATAINDFEGMAFWLIHDARGAVFSMRNVESHPPPSRARLRGHLAIQSG